MQTKRKSWWSSPNAWGRRESRPQSWRMLANNSFWSLPKTQRTTRWCHKAQLCPQAAADFHRNLLTPNSSTNNSPCPHQPLWDSAITLTITEASNSSSTTSNNRWCRELALRRTTTTRISSSSSNISNDQINGGMSTRGTCLHMAAMAILVTGRETMASIPLSINSTRVPPSSSSAPQETAARP